MLYTSSCINNTEVGHHGNMARRVTHRSPRRSRKDVAANSVAKAAGYGGPCAVRRVAGAILGCCDCFILAYDMAPSVTGYRSTTTLTLTDQQ